MKHTILHNKGFTLIETLVALSIFSLSIVALIVAAGQGVSNFQTIKARLTASYLAQEGVELVHNIRDTEITSGGDWNSFVSSTVFDCVIPNPNSVGCTIDAVFNPSVITVLPCGISSCAPLKYSDPIGYNYGSSSPIATIFERIISVEIIGVNEIKVKSTVNYTVGGTTSQIVMSEILTNWIGNISSSPSSNPSPQTTGSQSPSNTSPSSSSPSQQTTGSQNMSQLPQQQLQQGQSPSSNMISTTP